MKISDFFKSDGVNFASYDNYRKIASVADGLKTSARKCLYTFLKNSITTPKKVEQLQSLTAEQTQYIHGAQSLYGVIVGMAQDFAGANNIPYFKREGTFGTRPIPIAAAGRYIFTCMEDYLGLIYRKEDNPVLIEQNFEGDLIQYKYYVPILPMLAINGSVALTTGFKQEILGRNPKDCIKYIEAKLKGEKLPELNPWYAKFNGSILPNKDKANGWIITGKINKLPKNKIEIVDIPVNYKLEDYIEILDKLEDEKSIKSYQDLSESGNFRFIVTLYENKERGFNMSDPDLLSKLKLVTTEVENFTSLDENNKVVEYKSIYEIVDHYYDLRLEYYQKRKDYEVKSLTKKIIEMASRYIFVKSVVGGSIVVANKVDKEIEDQLSKTKNIIKVDGSYDYLLNMNIRSLTAAKYASLLDEIKRAKADLDELKTMTPKDMWLKDLDQLKRALPKI